MATELGQALGLDKAFNFDGSVPTPPKNFDTNSAITNIASIANSPDIRTVEDFQNRASQELINFNKNAAERQNFITGNNDFSMNQITGAGQLLNADVALNRDALLSAIQAGNTAVEAKYIADQKKLAEEQLKNDSVEKLQVIAATEYGIAGTSGMKRGDLIDAIAKAQAKKSGSATGSFPDTFSASEVTGNADGLAPFTNASKITGFGSPYWKQGLDVDLNKGDAVSSPFDGVVTFAGKNGGFGNQVKIKKSDGEEVWLSHLDGINVRVGDKVSRGTNIGIGGNTGNVIPGPGGDGSHLDITMKNAQGGYITPKDIASRLSAYVNNNL